MAEMARQRQRGGDARAADVLPMAKAVQMVTWLRGSGKLRDSALVAVASGFGLRISDALSLRWSDVLDDRGGITDAVQIVESKTKKPRTVFILPFVADALTAYRDVSITDRSAKLFPGGDKNGQVHRQTAWNLVRAAGKGMGLTLHLSPHSLRKSFCDYVYSMTRDAIMTARITGHSNPAQLLRYVGRVAEAEQDVWRRMAKSLPKA